MTPAVWTSEPPEPGKRALPWWIMRDDGPKYDSPKREIVWSTFYANSLLTRRLVEHGWSRSLLPIPSAERLAALEELASIVATMFTVTDATAGRVTQDNSQLVPLLTALSRLEACR